MSVHSNRTRGRFLGLVIVLVAIAILTAWMLFRSKDGAESLEPMARSTRLEATYPVADVTAETIASRAAIEMERGTESAPQEHSPSTTPGVLGGSVAFRDGSVPPPVLLKLVRYEDDSAPSTRTGAQQHADVDCVHEIHVPTDASGRFEAAGLCAGRYRAQVVLPQGILASGLFDVPAREARYVLEGYLLITRVFDWNRGPARGVHVAVEYQQDPDSNRPDPGVAAWDHVTDSEGCFWQSVLEPGDIRLRVRGLGSESPTDIVSLRMMPGLVHKDLWLPVAPANATLRIELTSCGPDRARIRDYCILLQEVGTDDGSLRMCSETAEDGVFRSLPPGRYHATPIARNFGKPPAYYRESVRPVWEVVLEAERETLFAQCVDLGGRILVLVRPDSSPSKGETVQIDLLDEHADVVQKICFREPTPGGGLQMDFALTIGVERLTDTLLDPGEHSLRVRANGRADQVVRVQVVAGEATRLVVDLQPAK